MTEDLQEYLARVRPDRETILQATRYYLAERTGDLSPDEMLERLAAEPAERQRVEILARTLARDSQGLETACLTVLAAAWDEVAEHRKLEAALAEAKRKLPVVETGILAIVAIYGLYLFYTGGKVTTVRRMARQADGSVKVEESVSYTKSPDPLTALVRLVTGGGGDADGPTS